MSLFIMISRSLQFPDFFPSLGRIRSLTHTPVRVSFFGEGCPGPTGIVLFFFLNISGFSDSEPAAHAYAARARVFSRFFLPCLCPLRSGGNEDPSLLTFRRSPSAFAKIRHSSFVKRVTQDAPRSRVFVLVFFLLAIRLDSYWTNPTAPLARTPSFWLDPLPQSPTSLQKQTPPPRLPGRVPGFLSLVFLTTAS